MNGLDWKAELFIWVMLLIPIWGPLLIGCFILFLFWLAVKLTSKRRKPRGFEVVQKSAGDQQEGK